MRRGGNTNQPLGDVQADVHIANVDSYSPLHNLFKLLTVRFALVLDKGNEIPSLVPIFKIEGPRIEYRVSVSKCLTFCNRSLIYHDVGKVSGVHLQKK